MRTLFFLIVFLFGFWMIGRGVSFLNAPGAEMSFQGIIRMLLGGLMLGPFLLVVDRKFSH